MENSISVDLMYEILSRLPGKSIARFRCVSKLWCSVLLLQDFTDLFLTRSATRRQDFTDLLLTRSSSSDRPRLLIRVHQEGERSSGEWSSGEWSFYSTPLPQNPYEKWSNVVAADSHKKFSIGISQYDCSYASGLIYFHKMGIPREDGDAKHVICNPLTGQYVILPELRDSELRDRSYGYLGFDPIDYEFKVLLIYPRDFMRSIDTHILTLGTGKLRWRKIQCPFVHSPRSNTICINGVLYYLALHFGGSGTYSIICFDIKSEKFKFIEPGRGCYNQLINYKGKLCGIKLEYGFPFKLSMWVLQDVKTQVWSKYVYSVPAETESDVVKVGCSLSASGVTATGDIVLTRHYQAPFYVCYLNPERKTLRIVELQGLGANLDGRVYADAFVDYAEDLSVNNALQFKSIPRQSQNIVNEGPKPQQCRDLSKSTQSVKNKYEVLAANLYEEDLSVNDAMQLESSPSQQGQNIATKRPKPQQRRHTSRRQYRKKQQNRYKLLANLLYHFVGLAVLFTLFYFLDLSFWWLS